MTDYTYNTGNPIGSTDVRDGVDNLKSFDVMMNSQDDTYQDRLGNTVPTAKGAIGRLGMAVQTWTATTGGTLTDASQVFLNDITASAGKGNYYAWTGAFPKIVAPGTDPAAVAGFVMRSDAGLRDELTSSDGGALVHHGAGSISDAVDSWRPLSYYGSDSAGLASLLNYAKTSGLPIRLTSDVVVTSAIDIDFEFSKLVVDFCGYSLLSDSECLILRNLGAGSEIHNPSLKNITAPWCITRWSGDNWISGADTVLATLTQTNNLGYYQPSVNDQDIWASLPSNVQTQNISAKMRVVGSSDVQVYAPRGRFCLYEFEQCHRVDVYRPDIQSGGKGTYGTILFKNIGDTSYGVGNKVHGGRVGYGTFSAVCFMRNKKGGVDGWFTPYRCGESGVKTYQNEVSGISARCYSMDFSDIFPYQTVYDGVDFSSDFGTQAERVGDYTLAQYPWHELPTAHRVTNVQSRGCNSTGVWGDGQFNRYTDVSADNCNQSGIQLITKNSVIDSPSVNECNLRNADGAHQLIVVGDGNVVRTPSVTTTSAITVGYAIYMQGKSATLIDEFVSGGRTAVTAPNRGGKLVDSLRVGSNSVSESTVEIDLHPRGINLANGAGSVRGVVTAASSGSEFGNVELRGRNSGALVKGIRAIGNLGGFGTLGVANTVNNTLLESGELYFYQSGTSVILAVKLSDGTVKTATVIA